MGIKELLDEDDADFIRLPELLEQMATEGEASEEDAAILLEQKINQAARRGNPIPQWYQQFWSGWAIATDDLRFAQQNLSDYATFGGPNYDYVAEFGENGIVVSGEPLANDFGFLRSEIYDFLDRSGFKLCRNVAVSDSLDRGKQVDDQQALELLAHKNAREAAARMETQKWRYKVCPEDVHVNLRPRSEQLDDISRDETVSMSVRNWIEFLADEIAERQQWREDESEAKLPVVRAEFLNLFVRLSDTLPLRQELTGTRWEGSNFPEDWLTRLVVSKTDLRDWAKVHALELANSRLLAQVDMATGAQTEIAQPATMVPTEAKPFTAGKPLPQQRHQEEEILRVIRALGANPVALPKHVPGKPGVKAAVRKQLNFSVKVFDKAWERLRSQDEIKEQ